MYVALEIAMNLKCISRFIWCISLIALLVLGSVVLCSAQESKPKTEAEIRALLNKSRSKDRKVADEARETLSKLDVRYMPTFIEISRKGKACERVGAANFIVSFDPNNKEILPILTELATGGSVSSSEEELLCRRGAAYQFAFSTEGVRILTRLLKEGKNLFVRQSAIFAFDELTETANYPEGSLEAMKEAIPVIAESGKLDDEVMQNMSNEVLWQIVRQGGD